MGFGRSLRPWRASLLIGAVVAAFLVSCESRSTTPELEPSVSGGPLVAPGEGTHTEAEARWAYRINVLCARRNERLHKLDFRDWPNEELARYTAESLEVWDNYARRAAAFRPPGSYARRARWLGRLEASLRQGLVMVQKDARAGDDPAVDSAIRAFQKRTSDAYPGLVEMGVPLCWGFEPYAPMD
jgi:hypothetical protein